MSGGGCGGGMGGSGKQQIPRLLSLHLLAATGPWPGPMSTQATTQRSEYLGTRRALILEDAYLTPSLASAPLLPPPLDFPRILFLSSKGIPMTNGRGIIIF